MNKSAGIFDHVFPKRPKPQQPAKDEFNTQFGFDKVEQGQRATRQTSLDQAFDFWRRNQTSDNMKTLLDAANPVIGRAITAYGGGETALRSKARRLALDAFKSYDPTRGAKLQTHLMVRLQPLQRAYLQRTSPVAIPERVQQDRYRLQQAERSMTEELGREPSDDELADRLSMPAKRIAHVRAFGRGTLVQSQLLTAEGEANLPATAKVTADDIWIEYVHHDLDPLDKKILEWKTGLYGKQVLSNNEIARRLKLSPGAISQRSAKIAGKLEQGATSGPAAR